MRLSTSATRALISEDHHVPHTLKKSALAAVAIAATAAAIGPAAASAATVSQSGGTLYVNALPGETNNMRVTLTNTYLEILENNSGGVQPQAGTTCITFSPGHARCNLTGVSFIRVNAGDMHDYVVGDLYSGSYAFTLSGGPGTDYLDVMDGRQTRVHHGEDARTTSSTAASSATRSTAAATARTSSARAGTTRATAARRRPHRRRQDKGRHLRQGLRQGRRAVRHGQRLGTDRPHLVLQRHSYAGCETIATDATTNHLQCPSGPPPGGPLASRTGCRTGIRAGRLRRAS